MRKYTVMKAVSGLAALSAMLLATGCATTAPERSSSQRVQPESPQRPAGSSGGFQTESVFSAGPMASSGAGPAIQPDAPLRYVVKKGDTLWGISQRFLVEPWQWPEVWVVNDQVRNPHLIYPGDVLTLVYRRGQPRVELAEGRAGPRVRESDIADAIPTIPIEAIRDFLRGPRLVTDEELENAPYVLDFVDLHIIGGRDHAAYAKRLPVGGGTSYQIVRLGERYTDPDSREDLGREAIPVSDAEVVEYGDPGTVSLTNSYRETHPGDYLLKPPPADFDSNFYPRAPSEPVSGSIISVFDGVSNVGQYQVITLNRGARDGLAPGHILDILQSGRSARDPHGFGRVAVPETYAGQVMVFKTEEKVSFGLVLSAILAVHELDRVTNPGSRPVLR